MPFSPRACVLSSLFFSFVWGQTTHIVTVGARGSFYEPATISAALNDTVRFIFEGPAHGIVQCAVDNPCFPLPGGFSSGVAGSGDNFSLPAPVWDLQITNVSHPIWFYCPGTLPVSHCASGMVGAVNPPSIEAYNKFKSAAEGVKTTALVVPSVVTNAPDAFATNSPLPTSTSSSIITSTPPKPLPESTTDTPLVTSSPPPVPTQSASHKTAIIGGSVGGGAVVVIVVLFALFMLCRHRRRARPGSRDFFRYKAQSPELGTNSANGVFTPIKVINSPSPSPSAALLRMAEPPFNSMQTTATTSPASLTPQRLHRGNSARAANPTHNPNSSDTSNVNFRSEERPSTREGAPSRSPRRPLLPASDPPAALDHKTSATSFPGASARDSASTNIHVLAREVAAVLMQNPQNVRHATRADGGESSSRNSTHGRTESPAPPKYRPS